MTIDKETVQKVLLRLAGVLAIWYFAGAGLAGALVYLLCIAFLTIAAYIFRFDRSRGVVEFLKMAFFAASPVYIGTNVVALSGTNLPGTWYVLIFISTIVMSRGVQHTSRSAHSSDA